jgi:hypothetical protein
MIGSILMTATHWAVMVATVVLWMVVLAIFASAMI